MTLTPAQLANSRQQLEAAIAEKGLDVEDFELQALAENGWHTAQRLRLASREELEACVRKGTATALKAAFGSGADAVAAAEDPQYTAFIRALCDAREELIDEQDEAGPGLLKLEADVIFPDLRTQAQCGRGIFPVMLVRRCWREFLVLVLVGMRLVVGTPGIGKSVFKWWFIRDRLAAGFKVIHQRLNDATALLCSADCVLAGKHDAFEHLCSDPHIWCVYDGLEPTQTVIDKTDRILVVSSPNRDRYKNFLKALSARRLVMPRWSMEEILLGREHIYPTTQYPDMTLPRVMHLFSYYNGVPRWVLAQPSTESSPLTGGWDLTAFREAVSVEDAEKVLRSVSDYDTMPPSHHRVLHLIPEPPHYRSYRVVYASEQAFLEVWQRAGAAGAAALQSFWVGSGNAVERAAMKGQVLEGVTRQDLACRTTNYTNRSIVTWFGPVSKKRKRAQDSYVQNITIEPGCKVAFTFDNNNFDRQLQTSWQDKGAWYRRTLLAPDGLTFPEVDCVMLPAPPPKADGAVDQVELYQITVSKTKEVNHATLAKILCALPDAKEYILYFVVPKEHFADFTLNSISRGVVGDSGQTRLDRVQVHVIANVEGVNALHSYLEATGAAGPPGSGATPTSVAAMLEPTAAAAQAALVRTAHSTAGVRPTDAKTAAASAPAMAKGAGVRCRVGSASSDMGNLITIMSCMATGGGGVNGTAIAGGGSASGAGIAGGGWCCHEAAVGARN